MNDERARFWRDRPVFVTGATGLLGGWLVTELLDCGAHVIALVRDWAPGCLLARSGGMARIVTVRGDLSDVDLLRRALCEYSVETVLHLAAQAIVGVARVDPIGTLEANVRGTWNLLEAARQAGVREIVMASSDKAYGASADLPYRESHPMGGQYPYDVSKSCADLIGRMYARTYGLPVGITRCGNLFGGGDLNFSRTVPAVILATMRGERFLIRSDGQYVRDYIYVCDAVDGYLRLAERLAADPLLHGEAFNFSLENRLTVLEVVRFTLKLMGRIDLQPLIQSVASGEIREQYMSAEKARQVLGWHPRIGFEDGLRRTIAWYEKHFAARAARVYQTVATA